MTLTRGMTVGCVMFVLVACGGGVSSTDPGTSSSSSSSGSSGSTCTMDALPVSRACVPPVAKANTAITLGIEGQGCEGCGATLQGCAVDVKGTTITLSLTMQTCPLPPDTGCATICKLPQTTCAIPPLAAGKYTVELAADVTKPGVLPTKPRALVVEDGATETSCALTQGPPQPLGTDGYAKSCTQPSDCAPVVTGDPCAPSCPNAAIATSAVEAYEEAWRARASSCPARQYGTGGACPKPTVSCDAGQCALGR